MERRGARSIIPCRESYQLGREVIGCVRGPCMAVGIGGRFANGHLRVETTRRERSIVKSPGLAFVPVGYQDVTIDGGLWGMWSEVVRTRTLPHIYQWLENSGRLQALMADRLPPSLTPHIFWDSDIYKWLEAASYALASHPDDDELRRQIDHVVSWIAQAQLDDGYVNTFFSKVSPNRRWTDLEGGHELYCAGHLIEAAVAHYQATKSHSLLDVARRFADYIISVFGPNSNQIHGYPGHEEIELALIKLYRLTGDVRYLNEAIYFVDQRGQPPHFFDEERRARGSQGFLQVRYSEHGNLNEYNQSHLPVRKQTEVVGHAVRAMYLYAAVADVYAETGDPEWLAVSLRLWSDMVTRKMYVTGGLGSSELNEGFTGAYDLPIKTAYAETCAAIGSVFWNHRLSLISGEGRFADLMEWVLFNAVQPAIALDGTHFFYSNPLVSQGEATRQEWYDVACCPPNIARLILSLGGYIYSRSRTDIAVHLLVQSTANIKLEDDWIQLRQITAYPKEAKTEIELMMNHPRRFGLRVRVPAWYREATLSVNGASTDFTLRDGYALVHREWQPGDRLTVEYTNSPQWIFAHPAVSECRGRTVLTYGPLVYCLEQADNGGELDNLFVKAGTPVIVDEEPGVVPWADNLRLLAERTVGEVGAPLYAKQDYGKQFVEVRAVPYAYWGNRGTGEMIVWLRRG